MAKIVNIYEVFVELIDVDEKIIVEKELFTFQPKLNQCVRIIRNKNNKIVEIRKNPSSLSLKMCSIVNTFSTIIGFILYFLYYKVSGQSLILILLPLVLIFSLSIFVLIYNSKTIINDIIFITIDLLYLFTIIIGIILIKPYLYLVSAEYYGTVLISYIIFYIGLSLLIIIPLIFSIIYLVHRVSEHKKICIVK